MDIYQQSEQLVANVVTNFGPNFDAWFNSQILNNSFFTAGVFTVLASLGLYFLRNVPLKIWNLIKYRATMTVNIDNDNPYFVEIAKELNENAYHFFSRAKILDDKKLTIGFVQSYSKFNGRFVICNRRREEGQSSKFKQSITITFPFFSNKKLEKLMTDFINKVEESHVDRVFLFNLMDYNLERIGSFPKRTEDSIFLKRELLEHIKSKLDFFVENREWYENHGIPYKYALILHGPPGTGKTSIAKFIASYLDRKLIISTPEKINRLSSAVDNINRNYSSNAWESDEMAPLLEKPNRFVCLMEDIDTFSATNSRNDGSADQSNLKQASSLTDLSSILNSIDGLNAPDDMIFIATTNHLDKLDSALIRPGRFDDVIEIGSLENEEIHAMIESFIDDAEFLEKIQDIKFEPIHGSNLQDILMSNLESPENILSMLTVQGEQHGKT